MFFAVSAKGTAAELQEAIKKCAALGFFLKNIQRDRAWGDGQGTVLFERGRSCKDASWKSRYLKFVDNPESKELNLYLGSWTRQTFKRPLRAARTPAAADRSRFRSLSTRRTALAP